MAISVGAKLKVLSYVAPQTVLHPPPANEFPDPCRNDFSLLFTRERLRSMPLELPCLAKTMLGLSESYQCASSPYRGDANVDVVAHSSHPTYQQS